MGWNHEGWRGFGGRGRGCVRSRDVGFGRSCVGWRKLYPVDSLLMLDA